MIKRELESIIKERLYKGNFILIFGARQVGKTTLLKTIFNKNHPEILWLNGDEADVKELLSNTTSTQLRALIGKNKLVVLDEAQRIENIGIQFLRKI